MALELWKFADLSSYNCRQLGAEDCIKMKTEVTKRILLVEDDPPLARVYCEYLRGEPFEVVHADTGKKHAF